MKRPYATTEIIDTYVGRNPPPLWKCSTCKTELEQTRMDAFKFLNVRKEFVKCDPCTEYESNLNA